MERRSPIRLRTGHNTQTFQLLKGVFGHIQLGRRKTTGSGGHWRTGGVDGMCGGVGGMRPMGSRRGGNGREMAKEVSDIGGEMRGQAYGGGGQCRRNW